jgi:hypothetical protein
MSHSKNVSANLGIADSHSIPQISKNVPNLRIPRRGAREIPPKMRKLGGFREPYKNAKHWNVLCNGKFGKCFR